MLRVAAQPLPQSIDVPTAAAAGSRPQNRSFLRVSPQVRRGQAAAEVRVRQGRGLLLSIGMRVLKSISKLVHDELVRLAVQALHQYHMRLPTNRWPDVGGRAGSPLNAQADVDEQDSPSVAGGGRHLERAEFMQATGSRTKASKGKF